MESKTYYTIEMASPGTWSLYETPVRACVRGFAQDLAWRYARTEGAVLHVRAGRKYENGKILSKYVTRDGRWVRAYGTEIRELEGKDGADVYMAKYPLPHVTREYAEHMAGLSR